MKEARCVTCGEPVLGGVIVCAECAKTLGQSNGRRSQESLLSYKVDKRRSQR
jgi:hypothetical protein